MIRNQTKVLVATGLALGAVAVLSVVGGLTAQAKSMVSASVAPRYATPPAASVNTYPDNPAILDKCHRLALGMIETGNNDDEIGGAGEVSRYQIMPSVWRHYSQSDHYQNPAVSLAVAQKHWLVLYNSFKRQAHREPSNFDMYVLWNTHYGYYASKGFKPSRLNSVVRDRAQRFANLVERNENEWSARETSGAGNG